jgi:two-component system response regulator
VFNAAIAGCAKIGLKLAGTNKPTAFRESLAKRWKTVLLGSKMNHAAILVVDDNPDHLELTVMALSECASPGEIETATDGVEALDYLFGRGAHALRDTSQQPRLLILDMKLVRLHGLDVLKAVRQDPRTATIPVVMHSSSTEKSDIAACYAHGANSYVRKATDYDELRRRMRQLYDFWIMVNERNQPTGA